MKKAFVLVPSLIAFVALAGCADEDTATTDTEHGGSTVDASADSTSSSEAATDNDASSQEDVSTSADGSQVDGAQGDESQGDGSTAEGGGDGDAGSTLPDSGSREAGPGGDGGLVIGGDSAASDATFQIKGPSGTNLLSSSDVNADCTGVAGATAGVYVVTCTEKTGSTGPCRTVTI